MKIEESINVKQIVSIEANDFTKVQNVRYSPGFRIFGCWINKPGFRYITSDLRIVVNTEEQYASEFELEEFDPNGSDEQLVPVKMTLYWKPRIDINLANGTTKILWFKSYQDTITKKQEILEIIRDLDPTFQTIKATNF